MRPGGTLATMIVLSLGAGAASAQATGDHLTPMQMAIACASPTTAAEPAIDTLKIIGGQNVEPRSVFDANDLLIVNGGTSRGLALGQEYYLRSVRTYAGASEALSRALRTNAWIKIVAVNDTTAVAKVTFACGPIFTNDYLEPFVAPEPPANADRVDSSGELDFAAPARVIYANDERRNAAVGDFVLIDQPAEHAAASGQRFAFYRDPVDAGMPLVSIGEGVAVAVGPAKVLVRVNQARGAIETGDYAVRRR